MNEPAEQLVPQNLEAEAAYLSALLLCDDPQARGKLRRMAWKSAFLSADHQVIYEVACQMIDAGEALDIVTLRAELQKRNVWDEVGGAAYLGQLMGGMPSVHHGEHYGAIVVEMAKRREALELAQKLGERLRQPADDQQAEKVIDRAIARLVEIRSRTTRVQTWKLGEVVGQFLEERQAKKSPALLSGVFTLDKFPGIFSFGKETVVAGRPSMGKSTLVRWLLGLWAQGGTPAGLVAVEEDRQKIAGNYLASFAGVENHHVAYGNLNAGDWEKLWQANGSAGKLPLYGVDTAFSLREVCDAVEILVARHGCRVVAVDHLHLIGGGENWESEQREIKEVSRALKELGKRLGIVLIVAAQLRRLKEGVMDAPEPTMSDLRASGAIEEHADAILLLHREDYYRPREMPTNECTVIIGKNRNGARGRCTLRAELEYQRFAAPVAEDPWGEDARQ